MIRQIYDHIALFLTFLAHCSYIPNGIHSIYLVYNFNSDLDIFNRPRSSVSSMVASKLDGPRGPWIDPCLGNHSKNCEYFFYKLRTKNCSKSRTKIGMSVDI